MPRCKNCKDKFEAKYFNQKYCLKDDCVKAFVEYAKKTEWKKKKKKLKEELETVQDLMNKLQPIFNKYIRIRDKDKPCISCGKPLKDKFDAGHFYSSGGHKSVTFNEDNVHGQCVYCNKYLHANLENYRINLIERIGQKRYQALRSIAQNEAHYTREELRELIDLYKQKIKEYEQD